MADTFEIRSSAFPYNMASWCREKSRNVVHELAQAIDRVNDDPILSEDTREDVLALVGTALHDALKLMSFAYGVSWSGKDVDTILTLGSEGYRAVAVRYGAIKDPDALKRIRTIDAFVAAFAACLEGDRVPNRTTLYDVLRETAVKHPVIDSLAALLEAVTINTLSWEAFRDAAYPLLDTLSARGR